MGLYQFLVASPVSDESGSGLRVSDKLAVDVRATLREPMIQFINSLVRLLSGGFEEQVAHSSSHAGPLRVNVIILNIPQGEIIPINANFNVPPRNIINELAIMLL